VVTRKAVGVLVILGVAGASGCGSDNRAACSTTPLALAPAGLTFTRLDATKGWFAWDSVAGATEYQLFVNGVKTKTMPGTNAELDIGSSAVDVTVAAINAGGMSPISSPFPVLFDVKVRACSSIAAAVAWKTSGNTDTQVAVSGASESTIACFDPTPTTDHHFGEVSACATPATAQNYGMLRSGSTATVTMLSRDEWGYLGQYQQTLALPSTACICVQNPNNPDDLCAPSLPDVAPCAAGFDLETGTAAASLADADLYLEGTPNPNGRWLDEVHLVAPNGMVVLKNSTLCDIDDVPAGPFVTSTPYQTMLATDGHPNPISFTDSIVVKTRSGRYAKVTDLCDCPSTGQDDGTVPYLTHLTSSGMDLSWITALAGATAFTE